MDRDSYLPVSNLITYDARGRVRTEDDAGTPGVPRVVLTYGYDAKGNLTAVSDNLGGQVGYSYTVRDQLAGASLSVGGVLGPSAAFGYDDAKRLTSQTREEGTTGPTVGTAFGYDNTNRLVSISHSSTLAGSLSSFTYGYDAAGRLTAYTGPDGSLAYAYDNTGQLTGVSGSASESFAYDANGNRTGGGYTVGSGNRLTSDGTYNYTFDAEGNRLTKTRISDGQVTSYTYDERNRLTEVQVRSAGGVLLADERSTYDALDRRISVLTDPDGAGPQPAARLWTAYRGDDAWADFDGSGTLQTRYLFGLGMDSLIARVGSGGAVGWYLTDNLGSVRQVVTTGGAALYAANYSAFGQVRSSTGTGGDRFGYAGRELSGVTGEMYYRARIYDPISGRFLSQDPKSFAAGDMNLYRYVSNSPLANADPSGMGLMNRLTGVVEMFIGAVGFVGGTLITFASPEPGPFTRIGGVALMAISADVFVAGFRRTFYDSDEGSFLNQGATAATGSKDIGGAVESLENVIAARGGYVGIAGSFKGGGGPPPPPRRTVPWWPGKNDLDIIFPR